jgi:predicted nucleotidyltransferase
MVSVVLLGSHARGEAHGESDRDCLVIEFDVEHPAVVGVAAPSLVGHSRGDSM